VDDNELIDDGTNVSKWPAGGRPVCQWLMAGRAKESCVIATT